MENETKKVLIVDDELVGYDFNYWALDPVLDIHQKSNFSFVKDTPDENDPFDTEYRSFIAQKEGLDALSEDAFLSLNKHHLLSLKIRPTSDDSSEETTIYMYIKDHPDTTPDVEFDDRGYVRRIGGDLQEADQMWNRVYAPQGRAAQRSLESLSAFYEQKLSSKGMLVDVEIVRSAAEALDKINNTQYDVVLTDLGMPCDTQALEEKADNLQMTYDPEQGAKLVKDEDVDTWKFDARSQAGLALSAILEEKGVDYRIFTGGHGIGNSLVQRTVLQLMDTEHLMYIQDTTNYKKNTAYTGVEIVKAGDTYFSRKKTISNWYLVLEDSLERSCNEQKILAYSR